MRKTLSLWVLLAGLVFSTNAFASASFANRSLGLGVSGFGILGDSTAIGIDWGIPVTLEGGLYLESGFELFLRVPLVFGHQKFDSTGRKDVIILASGGNFGVRYLFLEESVRPFAELHLAGLYFVRDAAATMLNNFFIGPGAGGGCDFFVSDSISIGARLTLDMYVTLNTLVGNALSFSLGGGVYATTYF